MFSAIRSALELFDLKQNVNYKTEVLAGVTVAMTMIPEALSFAILAGLPPLVGLYAAFIMGLTTAVWGGRPGLISGGAGATAIVLVSLMKLHGIEYVFAAVILAGIFQILVGLLRFGKFIRLVPLPVMYGFVNGLAVVLIMAQVKQFKTPVNGSLVWLDTQPMLIMAGLVALTIAVIVIMPMVTKAVPASLIGIMVVSLVVIGFNINTGTVGDIASVHGGLPPFHIPGVPLTLATLNIIMPYALVLAGVGVIEGLLGVNVVDDVTATNGNGNRECVAQGGANILNGFFFGMGGCAMIGQTMINLSSGARTRISGIVSALTILAIILFGAPVVDRLPMAALTGVMVMVAVATFKWSSLRMINKMPRQDVFVGIAVAVITIWLDNLALAVLVGVIISALRFAWQSTNSIHITKYTDEDGAMRYNIHGPLFFGSATTLTEQLDIDNDPGKIILDLRESFISDMSAIEVINQVTEKYNRVGKTLYLKNLSPHSRKLLQDADPLIKVHVIERG